MTKNTVPRIPRNGRTARDLAEQLGVTPQTIRKWTAEPREVYEARAAERHELIHKMRADGLSMRAIAAQLDVSVGTVHYALNKDKQPSEV